MGLGIGIGIGLNKIRVRFRVGVRVREKMRMRMRVRVSRDEHQPGISSKESMQGPLYRSLQPLSTAQERRTSNFGPLS